MPSTYGSNAAPPHIVDIAGELDPLAPLVIRDGDSLWARRLDRRVLQLRLSLDLRRRDVGHVVAWGDRAYGVARAAEARGIYRPLPGNGAPATPAAGWRALATSAFQSRRLQAAGWRAQDCVVIPPPGVDLQRRRGSADKLRRHALGIADDDYLWLLAGDPSPDSGLREAIWAGTVLHVLERGDRRHRLLLWGDSLVHQRARRFANQLGLPELCVATARYAYHVLADLADAAILLPRGAGATWSASVVALAGLPAVINAEVAIQEVLGGRPNIRTAARPEPRATVREMLRLSEQDSERIEPDRRFDPVRLLAQWRELTAKETAAS